VLTNGSEVTLQGKRVRLRPCEETDMDTMYKWRNDMSTLHLWSIRRHTVNFDEFAAELKADFAIDRHIQLMIEKVADNSVVGTIYSYNAQFVDGHCWITIYIEPYIGKWGRSPVKYLFCDKNYFCFLRGILPSAQVKIGMWLLPRFMM